MLSGIFIKLSGVMSKPKVKNMRLKAMITVGGWGGGGEGGFVILHCGLEDAVWNTSLKALPDITDIQQSVTPCQTTYYS